MVNPNGDGPGLEVLEAVRARVEANRQAEREALLGDARLRIKRLRVVTVDYYFHVANLLSFWMWFGWVGYLCYSEPIAGLLCAPLAGWFGMRAYRYIREDWSNVKRDLMGAK